MRFQIGKKIYKIGIRKKEDREKIKKEKKHDDIIRFLDNKEEIK